METSNPNPGSTIINVGGRQLGVLFPHGVLPAPDLENMLSLISQFVAAWNAATPDTKGKVPTAPIPPLVVFVTSPHHTSNSDIRLHVSLNMYSDDGWGGDPKSTANNVHVYSKNDNIEDGYDSFKIHQNKTRPQKSTMVIQQVTDALKAPFGTWDNSTIPGFPANLTE